jgi:lambda family phage tail tape measure protein
MGELSAALKDSKVFERAFDGGIDALSEFIRTGKSGFREWALDAVNQIQKVIIKLLIMKAIKAAGEGLSSYGAGGGTGSGWASAIGGALTSFAGGEGKNMGGEIRAMSLVHARRFQHGGEVLGPPGTDNVPAMLTPGERVLTRSEAKDYERGPRESINVTVNINGVSDFQSFRQNKGELQAAMAQTLARANVRNN